MSGDISVAAHCEGNEFNPHEMAIHADNWPKLYKKHYKNALF